SNHGSVAENSAHEREHHPPSGSPDRLCPCRNRLLLAEDGPHRGRSGGVVAFAADRPPLESEHQHDPVAPGVPGVRPRGDRVTLPTSNDSAKAGMAPATTDVEIKGRVMSRKTWKPLAPRSIAASIKEPCVRRSLASTLL